MDISRQVLSGAAKSGRVPNAYLFTGSDPQALLDEALFLANALECRVPDLITLSSQGKNIKIDEIRQITSFVKYGPAQCPWKVIIIPDADLMTEEAANSFLKTLEEPHEHILFVLTTTRPSKILKTIASRCQSLYFAGEKKVVDDNAARLADIMLNAGEYDIPKLLSFSDEMAADPDPEGALNSALYSYREKIDHTSPDKFRAAKKIFSAIRALERRGNKRLTFDSLFLDLHPAIGGVKEAVNN